MVDLIELTEELWRAYIEQQLQEMLAIKWHDGAFKSGWESAIEEFQERLRQPVQQEAG
jgi:hypothetical protein